MVCTPNSTENGANFLTAAEMRGKIFASAEAAEIDDAFYTGFPSGGSESVGGAAIFGFEGIFGAHGVDQVVGGVDSGEVRGERGGIEDVAEDNFRFSPRR